MRFGLKNVSEGRSVAFWTRGIVPENWNTVPPPPEWNSGEGLEVWAVGYPTPSLDPSSLEVLPCSTFPLHNRTAFLNGLGTSGDARVCRVGWGVYLVEGLADLEVDPSLFQGFFGTLAGARRFQLASSRPRGGPCS